MKLIFPGLVFSGAVATAAIAQPAEQFDLECSGQIASEKVGASTDRLAPVPLGTAPYTTHLRVDLKAQDFCQDDCKGSEPIPLIAPNAIVLRSGGGMDQKFLSVDRGSGSFTFSWNEDWEQPPLGPYVHKEATGQCTKVPFTQLPKKFF